jgi:hypothetical protein
VGFGILQNKIIYMKKKITKKRVKKNPNLFTAPMERWVTDYSKEHPRASLSRICSEGNKKFKLNIPSDYMDESWFCEEVWNTLRQNSRNSKRY